MSKCCDNGNESIEAAPLGSCGCATTTCGCGATTKCKCATCCNGYKNVVLCQEDNTTREYVYAIFGSITSVQAFAMPACGGTVTVEFDHICNVAIGTWLWADGVGYLEVTASSTSGRTLSLKNICPGGYADQADDGASIPVGTQFVLGVPQLNGTDNTSINSSLYPYLNSGFLAPENGSCVEIAVTNVNGLAVGKLISLNGATYRIDSIDSPTQLTICNDGAGLTPGITVDYKDVLGNLLVPIVLIDSNPCTNPTINSGKILACSGGVTSPLVGNQNNQLLVYDHVSGNANFRSLGIPTVDCVELTANLVLDPTFPSGTSYLVYVSSSAAFTAGDTVLVGGTEMTVDVVLDGTTMRVIPLVDPVAIQNYIAGSTLCGASCCEILDLRADALELRVLNNVLDQFNPLVPWLDAKLVIADSTAFAGSLKAIGGTVAAGNIASLTLTNNSGQYPMLALFQIQSAMVYDYQGVVGEYAGVTFQLNSGGAVGGVAPAPLLTLEQADVHSLIGTTTNRYSKHITWTLNAIIPPVSQHSVSAQIAGQIGAGNLSTGINFIDLNTRITATGVAIRA